MTTTLHHTQHLTVARRYAADPDAWPLAPRFNPDHRWYHRIAETPGHEVWLLAGDRSLDAGAGKLQLVKPAIRLGRFGRGP
jgi:hypothetical protein